MTDDPLQPTEAAAMEIQLDMSSMQVGGSVLNAIHTSLSALKDQWVAQCPIIKQLDRDLVPAITVGSATDAPPATLTQTMLPGLVTLVLHFMAVAVTADSFVSEKEGTSIFKGISALVVVVEIQVVKFCLHPTQIPLLGRYSLILRHAS